MITLEQILYIIPVLALAASITYYAMTIRNQNKTRQTQLFLQFYNRLTDKQFYDEFKKVLDQEWSDLDDYIEKYGYGPTLFDIYLEGVGLLVKRGEIDISLVARAQLLLKTPRAIGYPLSRSMILSTHHIH